MQCKSEDNTHYVYPHIKNLTSSSSAYINILPILKNHSYAYHFEVEIVFEIDHESIELKRCPYSIEQPFIIMI